MSYAITDIKKGWYIAIYRKQVSCGELKDGKITEENKDDDLLELHIFGEGKEYRKMITADTAYKEVILSDSRFEGCETDDQFMMLFGEEFIKSDEYSYTVKEKGKEYTFYLPFKKENFDNGIFLKVRNYYDYDENDLLYLKGYRLIGIGEKK